MSLGANAQTIGANWIYDKTTNAIIDVSSPNAFEIIKGRTYFISAEIYNNNQITQNYNITYQVHYMALTDVCNTSVGPSAALQASSNNPNPSTTVVQPPSYVLFKGKKSCNVQGVVFNPADGFCYLEVPCVPDISTPIGEKCIESKVVFPPAYLNYRYCNIVEKTINLNITGTITPFGQSKVTTADFVIPADAIHGGNVWITATSNLSQPFSYGGQTYTNVAKSYNTLSNNVITPTTPTEIYAKSANIGNILGNVPTGGDAGYVYKYIWQSSQDGVSWTSTDLPIATTQNYNPGKITTTTWFRRWAYGAAIVSNVIKFTLIVPSCSVEQTKAPNVSVADQNICPNGVKRITCTTDFGGFARSYSWYITHGYANNSYINRTFTTTTPYLDIDYKDDSNLGITLTRFSMRVNFDCGAGRSTLDKNVPIPSRETAPTGFLRPDGYQLSATFFVQGRPNTIIRVDPTNQNYNFTLTPTKIVTGVAQTVFVGASSNIPYVNLTIGNYATEGFTLRATNPRMANSATCPNFIERKFDIFSDQTVSTGGYMFDLYSTGMPYRGKSYIRVPSATDPNVNSGTDRFNFGTINFTMEAWVQGKTNSYNLAEYTIFSNWTNTLQAGFRFGANPTSNKLYFKANGQTYESDALTAGTFTDNTCRHVAVVREGTVIKFYINGVLSGTRTINGTMNITNGNFYLIGTDTEETTDDLGNRLPINNFVGVIREARLWKEPKTQTFIVDNMRKKISAANQNGSGLASYLRLNDGAGTSPADLAYTGYIPGTLGYANVTPALNGIGLYYDYLPGQSPRSGSLATWSYATCSEMVFRKEAASEETINTENVLANEVSIYPNPTSGMVEISVTSDYLNKDLAVYDMQGKKIQSQIIADFQTKIDLSGLPTGMYYIKLGAKTFKLILSK